jgi:hypothetical protein
VAPSSGTIDGDQLAGPVDIDADSGTGTGTGEPFFRLVEQAGPEPGRDAGAGRIVHRRRLIAPWPTRT